MASPNVPVSTIRSRCSAVDAIAELQAAWVRATRLSEEVGGRAREMAAAAKTPVEVAAALLATRDSMRATERACALGHTLALEELAQQDHLGGPKGTIGRV